MPIQFLPYSQEDSDAVRSFNERMSNGLAATDFLLPDGISPVTVGERIRQRHYLARDGGNVRGGYLEVRYPLWLMERETESINCQSPLSEGLINKAFVMLPLQMMKYMQRQNGNVFLVGMGGMQQPLPRLLRAAGWSVEPVPFFYRVCRMGRFLTQLPLLQKPVWKRVAAMGAAYSGMGAAAAVLWHRARVRVPAACQLEAAPEWGAWSDEIWEEFRQHVRFAVSRDQATLRELYPAADSRLERYALRSNGQLKGWAATVLTPMRASRHFGNLRVGTILDCMAGVQAAPALILLTMRELARRGADVVISNQSHALWQNAFELAGFQRAGSNYLFAASPDIAATLGATPVSSGEAHITRGDGDGRIHL